MGHAQTAPPAATIITSSGLSTQVQLNGGTHDITGTPTGTNLFHSFGQFTIAEGGVANFVGSPGVANVLGRVTGGDVSKIWGTIQTTGFDAGFPNLFLINPAGWVFGPTASINVGGSFHVSTANYIRLSDEVQFNVSGAGDELLTTAAPAAFGFSGPAAPILVEGAVLTVPETKTLSLVGGDVSITGGTLVAPSGRIAVVGVASAGEVAIPDFNVGLFSSLGQITISADSSTFTPSVLDASGIPLVDPDFFNPIGGGAGGEIIIRGGQLVATGAILQTGGFGGATPKIDVAVTDGIALESSLLDASGKPTFDTNFNPTGGGAGGALIIRGHSLTATSSALLAVTYGSSNGATPGIDIALTGDLQMQTFSGMTTATLGSGRAGDVAVTARSVILTDNSSITTSTLGTGAGGDVNVSTSGDGSFVLSGFSSIGTATSGDGTGGKIVLASPSIALDGGAFVISQSLGAAAGGDLVVEAGNLMLSGGGSLRSETSGAAGGNILVTATGSAMIAGADSGIFSGGSGLVEGAPAGNISLSARNLTVTGGARIQNGAIADRAGAILVQATDSIVISDHGKILSQAFVNDVGDVTISAPSATLVMDTGLIQTSTIQNGNAGNVIVDVASLSLTNGAQIVTSSAEFATGRGGNLTISAANSVSMSGSSPGDPVSVLSGNDSSSGLFSTASVNLDPAAQGGGQIAVSTAVLTMSDGAKVSAFTPGAGPAGNISLNATGALSVSGSAQIVSSTTSGGAAGSIALTGAQVDVVGGGRVVSETSSMGNAGTVAITATNTITVSDGGSAVSTTTFGDGKGGDVALSANQVNIQNGGRVTSESGGLLGGSVTVGTGASGQVTISAGDTITVSGPEAIVSTSTFGDGDGGNVTLSAGNRVNILNGGAVRADSGGILNGGVVSGAGLGGSITISAGTEIVLNNGQITTETLTADGGNITLLAPNLVQLEDSIISTSVQGGEGTGGNINIDPQFVLVNNSSIIANAFGGPGGNITIVANNFLSSATSVIEASSALSTPGVIEIRSPENNVENSISQLPAAFIDASALLRGLCTARRTGAPSSFVVAGRGGVPVEADGYLPSFGTDVAAAMARTRTGDSMQSAAGRTGEPLVFALLANTLDCAR